jgi:aspartate ammonia-lyase
MDWSGHLASRSVSDVLGDVEVPAGALYGAHTARALRNSPPGGPRLSDFPELITALAAVKVAAARANRAVGVLDRDVAEAIEAAGREVLAGRHHGQFVLPVVQGGGGTSTHMNANEVLAARATQIGGIRVHPNDHVNRGQSTNDVMPTAIGIAGHRTAVGAVAALRYVARAIDAKASEYDGQDHLGRTCLQDAVPIPIPAVHRGQAFSVRRAADDLEELATRLLAVPLGGTAVGTGLGAADGFAERALAELAVITEMPVRAAPDRSYALASLEPLAAVVDGASRAGRAIARIATDLRLLASGPRGAIGEVELPSVQAGSSQMPGKINPVIPELVMQTAFQLAGASATAHLAVSAGELEVSAMAPVVTLDLLAGLGRLEQASRIFADRCITGLRWRLDTVAAHLAGSLADATTAAATDGYDATARAVYARRS